MFIEKDSYKTLDFDFVTDKIMVHSPYGEELKRAMKTFGDDEEARHALEREYDLIEKSLDYIGRYRYECLDMRNEMKNLKNLGGSFDRIAMGEILGITELFEIKGFLLILKKLSEVLKAFKPAVPEELSVGRMENAEKLLDPDGTGTNTFFIYDSYSEELKAVRGNFRETDGGLQAIRKSAREAVEEEFGIKVKSGSEAQLQVAKHDKALIERLEAYPSLAYSSENMMYKNYRLLYGDEADNLEMKLLDLKRREEELEMEVCRQITKQLHQWLPEFRKNCAVVGRLDFVLAKAYFALGYSCIRPVIVTDQTVLDITEGRYIKVENQLRAQGKHYTAVSVDVQNGVACITGANMGGKTVTLKMIGQLLIMAQSGLFVPAMQFRFSPLAYVAVTIGDSQNVDKGLSTFGAEIISIRKSIDLSGQRGLILIDELARGTNPKEGYAISRAIIDHLKVKPSITIITTHFDGLADEDDVLHLQVRGLQKSCIEEVLIEDRLHHVGGSLDILNDYMDYRLRRIDAPEQVPKDAINISEILGLNDVIIQRARDIINEQFK